MKQIIVLFAMIILGVGIYGFIMSEDNGGIYGSVKKLWQSQIEHQTTYP